MLQFHFIFELITPSVLTFQVCFIKFCILLGSYQQGSRDGELIYWRYFGDTLGIRQHVGTKHRWIVIVNVIERW